LPEAGARALDPVICAPEASVIKVEGLVGYQVALTREAARPESDARLEEMMRRQSRDFALGLAAVSCAATFLAERS
jgi:hypothetical protein